MALPFATNTTCDIYRSGNAPPAAPDVAGVACRLLPDFTTSHEAATAGSTTLRWTHVLLVDAGTDLRDGYKGYGVTKVGQEADPASWDTVYVPDRNGTPFAVVFVERVGLGTGADHKRAYLQRQQPTWPTNNV